MILNSHNFLDFLPFPNDMIPIRTSLDLRIRHVAKQFNVGNLWGFRLPTNLQSNNCVSS